MSKPKILYVDDENINLLLFKANLQNRYDVLTAISVEDALEKIGSNPDIRIVFSDMRMPGMNGIEFFRKVRPLLPEVHFYILTGFDITHEIKQALEEGLIREYIKKPFHYSRINAEIEASIKVS